MLDIKISGIDSFNVFSLDRSIEYRDDRRSIHVFPI